MSDRFSVTDQKQMNIALQNTKHISPFKEEEEDVVKSEDGSPLFVSQESRKRPATNEDEPRHKRTKESYIDEILAYGGKPVQQYKKSERYNYEIHEQLPELEVNSRHHKKAAKEHNEVLVLPLLQELRPSVTKDAELANYHKNFHKLLKIPQAAVARWAFTGASGSGKSTTINKVLSIGPLTSSSKSSKSVTQVALLFCNATHGENFKIVISLFHQMTIKTLLGRCLEELSAFIAIPKDQRNHADNQESKAEAHAALLILKSLIQGRSEFKSLDRFEDFLNGTSFVKADGSKENPVEHLLKLVEQRAKQEGVDWEERRKKIDTAQNAADVNSKIKPFSEQGGLAPIVSEILVTFYSYFLAQGVEIVDLPGLNDVNPYLRRATLIALGRCPRLVVVANKERCRSDSELYKLLNKAIQMKGIQNVLLVIRGKESVDHNDIGQECTIEEEEELEEIQERINEATDVAELEKELKLKQLSVFDRIITQEFQEKFPDPEGKSALRVLTISNSAYGQHENYKEGDEEPELPLEATGIPALRAILCSAPGIDQVAKFKGHLLRGKKLAQQLLVCLDPEKLPSHQSVLNVFNSQPKLSLNNDIEDVNKSVEKLRTTLRSYSMTKWPKSVEETFEEHKSIAGITIASCIRKNGNHEPKGKPVIRLNQQLIEAIPGDFAPFIKSVQKQIELSSSAAIEKASGTVADLRFKLEQFGNMGGTDVEHIWGLFDTEREQCIKSIQHCNSSYAEEVRSIISTTVSDESYDKDQIMPAFMDSMLSIYKACQKRYPPRCKEKGLRDLRLTFLKEAVLQTNGPFAKMSAEIFSKLQKACNKWAAAIEKRVQEMLQSLEAVLLNSFEGKKMSPSERAKIAPKIRAVAEQAIKYIDETLSMYHT